MHTKINFLPWVLCMVVLLGSPMENLIAKEGLLDIYKIAERNDPQLKLSEATLNSVQTGIAINRAALLPGITGQIRKSDNRASSVGTTARADDPDMSVDRSSLNTFINTSFNLRLTQSIYHHDQWLNYKQSFIAVDQAEVNYIAAQQSLIIRVAEGYFEVLSAQSGLDFAIAEKASIARQLEQTQQRFNVGLIAITDVHEAQATFDLALADEILAQNTLDNAIENLREITGQYHQDLSPVQDEITLQLPEPAEQEKWISVAEQQNLTLKAARFGVEMARKKVQSQRAGHLPTLDFVANFNRNNSTRGGKSRNENGSVAVEFNIPILSGGLVSAQTRRAIHDLEKSQQEMDIEHRAAIRLAKRSYLGVIAGVSRVKALRQAVVSGESALKATQAGFEVGTRTIVDVLVSTRSVFFAKRNFHQARHTYLLDRLRLKQAVGTLGMEDLQGIETLLN